MLLFKRNKPLTLKEYEKILNKGYQSGQLNGISSYSDQVINKLEKMKKESDSVSIDDVIKMLTNMREEIC